MKKGKMKSGTKGFLLGILSTLVVLLVIVAAWNWDYVVHRQESPTNIGGQAKVAEISTLINRVYLGEVDQELLTDYMCLGLVTGLEDKYSTYYTAEQYEKIKQSNAGHYLGIGIGIMQDADSSDIIVNSCTEDSPAAKAGIEVADVLREIDGKSTEGMTSAEVVSAIQAKKDGESVSLTLQRGADLYTTDVTIQDVESISVTGKMLDENTKMGYIQITEFTGVTAEQFAKNYQSLQEQGMKSLIIDLRNNGGGLVKGVCDTLRQILPEGLIVYTEDKAGNRAEESCDGETPIAVPLVVLVNAKTASASEIFSGAVQDYEIGTIVGTVTYGKGVVQDTYALSGGGAVKLTISKYYTPLGHNIDGTGITPDVMIEQEEDAQEDLQLDKAVEILSEK